MRHLNYYYYSTDVGFQRGNRNKEWNIFFSPGHVIEDDRDLVKTQCLSEA